MYDGAACSLRSDPETVSARTDRDSMSTPLDRRDLLLGTLFAAQVAASTGLSMTLAVGSIMAAAITGTNTWSGLPVAVGSLGTALASWPLSRLMSRYGRRNG